MTRRALLLLPLLLSLAGCSVCTEPGGGALAALCSVITPAPTPEPTPEPQPAPDAEIVFTPGVKIEREVSPAGGGVSFEAWVPEAGRSTDWGAAELLMLYDADRPRAKAGRFAALLPYKAKWCEGDRCKEPRYNLPWDRWRAVRCEWTASSIACTIDGVRVPASMSESWGPRVRAVIGCVGARCLEGARVRGVKWE